MRIADITFHGAHNYGSVLQAYALQTFIKKLCDDKGVECDYRIINYRSPFQKELYGEAPASNIKGKMKSLMELPYRKLLRNQRGKFEDFLREQLHLTEEINTESGLAQFLDLFDVFVSGSDQIWNVRARDFSFAYLFENVEGKKISYAASLGPQNIDWSRYDKDRYVNALKQYVSLSVREEKSRQMVDELLGRNASQVHVDPTLLLPVEEWRSIQSEYNYNGGKYILFYCLEPDRTQLRIADEFSRHFGLPIVITGYRNKRDYFNRFVKCYDAGPLDFLSLIDHASIVLTASFHGTAFSIIYNKPFFAINGMRDNRIANILKLSGLEKCSVDANTDISQLSFCQRDNVAIENYINFERERSREYLIGAIGI